MKRALIRSLLIVACVLAGGCASGVASRMKERPAAVARLDADTKQKIERGVVEPGFTPEMVYLALGKPTSPATADIENTREGTWVYRSFRDNDRDFVRAGFRRRVVFDPLRKSDVVITEPVDERLFPNLQDRALQVTFREGRVVEVQRSRL